MKHHIYFHPVFLLLLLTTSTTYSKSLIGDQTGIKLDLRVFLKGPLINTSNIADLYMRDDLRHLGLLPEEEPYSAFENFQYAGINAGGETITKESVFNTIGANAIVDWIFVEIRDPDIPKKVLAVRSALLQRDGDVVEVDGTSSLHFEEVPAGGYYVAIRHRNHLGIMTAVPHQLGEDPVSLDFTDPDFAVYGTDARAQYGDRMVMHAGDFNQNGTSIFMGPDNDIFYLFSSILSSAGNPNYNANFIKQGYHLSDLNLDGMSIFNGPNNERTLFVQHVIGDCYLNNQSNCLLVEQIPK